MNVAKKIFAASLVFSILAISLVPLSWVMAAEKTGLVTCGTKDKPCTLDDLIGTSGIIQKIVDLILKQIVPALATVLLIIGGLILLTSAGSPERVSLGKRILFSAIIGLVLSLGAWAIIKFILQAIGAKQQYIPQ